MFIHSVTIWHKRKEPQKEGRGENIRFKKKRKKGQIRLKTRKWEVIIFVMNRGPTVRAASVYRKVEQKAHEVPTPYLPLIQSLPHPHHPALLWSFVSINEPILRHCCSLRSILYIRAHFWCRTFLCVWSDSQHRVSAVSREPLIAIEILGALSLSLPSSSSPATTDLSTVCISLPFPGCHRVRTTRYTAFSGRLLSLVIHI